MDGLSIRDLHTGYGKKKIIDGLTTPLLPRGKITALLGPNGSGKSTLLRALADLNPAQGVLSLNGVDLMTLIPAKRAQKVVYLPQSLPAGVHLHALESVIVARRASGYHQGNAEQEAYAILEKLGVAHLAMHFLDQLSGGQKQLIGLAQSLVRQPDLLLLDEPLSALDLNYQFHVMDIVARETRLRNIVTVVVIHDINIALRHAEYAVMMKNGALVASGVPDEVVIPQNLATVYGVRGRVEHCSQGLPHVVVDGLTT
ncbi:ABC transporter ATP-binding protein [Kluyvera ascorbata]|jgi:ABC-type cobalamin/Fe3+-siderophores transport systems, ATPase components|uniref:ABC transporter ATP-binding protein n=2 Tax=Kluyvera ascorbata TaxID=51288 RepID=A0AB35X8D9_9ENTR|nr:ABC transporter ATP-binding protein [Kluyvera ascorbata]MDT8700261.1 ABC transporter ATP-binding protein [Kluyvera ascorbata]MDU3913357.1 ABC transporter ATP-binding protein [Kluyvera ascorbata]MDZ4030160.1 ABC transporter ATP-binding protein [Kluyvera ascorbata]UPQ70118.1 ABC transporter ATP-binding protein [Kluyvera ascorbata]HDG1662711.1 ABC transporter ATP-binding protein [Kluyvera ascorbata]